MSIAKQKILYEVQNTHFIRNSATSAFDIGQSYCTRIFARTAAKPNSNCYNFVQLIYQNCCSVAEYAAWLLCA